MNKIINLIYGLILIFIALILIIISAEYYPYSDVFIIGISVGLLLAYGAHSFAIFIDENPIKSNYKEETQ